MKPVLLTDFVTAIQKIDPSFQFETNFFDESIEISVTGEHLKPRAFDLFTITWRGEPVTFTHYRKALNYVTDIYNFLMQ